MKNQFDQLLSNVWWLLLVRGLIAILLGSIALLGPGITLRFIIICWSIYMLVDGVVSLLSYFKSTTSSPHWWIILSSVLSILAGCICIINPDIATSTFIIILGWVCIFKGILELIGGLFNQSKWFIAAGILSLIFGVWCLNDPISVAKIITQILAIFVIFVGVGFTILSIKIRSMRNKFQHTIDI